MFCDGPSDDDDDEDYWFFKPRVWTQQDRLTPRPPQGWVIFTMLDTDVSRMEEIGVWLCAIGAAQEQSRLTGTRLHMIARDHAGDRFLLVHASLLQWARDGQQEMSLAIQHCNCGGRDCLAGKQQARAEIVLARRKWKTMDIIDRVGVLIGEDISLDAALDPSFTFERACDVAWSVNEEF